MMLALATVSEDDMETLVQKKEAAWGIWYDPEKKFDLVNYPGKNAQNKHTYAFNNFLCPDYFQHAVRHGGNEGTKQVYCTNYVEKVKEALGKSSADPYYWTYIEKTEVEVQVAWENRIENDLYLVLFGYADVFAKETFSEFEKAYKNTTDDSKCIVVLQNDTKFFVVDEANFTVDKERLIVKGVQFRKIYCGKMKEIEKIANANAIAKSSQVDHDQYTEYNNEDLECIKKIQNVAKDDDEKFKNIQELPICKKVDKEKIDVLIQKRRKKIINVIAEIKKCQEAIGPAIVQDKEFSKLNELKKTVCKRYESLVERKKWLMKCEWIFFFFHIILCLVVLISFCNQCENYELCLATYIINCILSLYFAWKYQEFSENKCFNWLLLFVQLVIFVLNMITIILNHILSLQEKYNSGRPAALLMALFSSGFRIYYLYLMIKEPIKDLPVYY